MLLWLLDCNFLFYFILPFSFFLGVVALLNCLVLNERSVTV
uniref:Uncharacterized protein n=1 Tax=Rhizophora mucronata TaxID=61149 RepID=A0A2P2L3C5_RHIMU